MTTDKLCTLVLFRRDDEILLAMKKRGFGANLWNGVGGKIEADETMEEALVRESQEEVGLTPLSWHKVAIHDFVMDVSDDPATEPWHMHVHVFICDKWQGEPQESEEMAPRWYKLQDIPYDEMWQDDIVWLPLALKGKLLRCRFEFEPDNTMRKVELEIVESLG